MKLQSVRPALLSIAMAVLAAAIFAPTAVASPPTAVTLPPEIDGLELKLRGSVNPEGSPTTYQFELSVTEDFKGSWLLPETPESVGGGTEDVPVSLSLGSLPISEPFYYRIVARNSDKEVSYGDTEFVEEMVAVWFQGEESVGSEEEPTLIDATADLSFTLGFHKFFCDASNTGRGKGKVFNDPAAKATFPPIFGSCTTESGSCTGWFEPFSGEGEGTSGSAVSSNTVQYRNLGVYVVTQGPGCPSYFFSGSLTGEWRNPGEENEGCIVYEENTDLKMGMFDVSTSGTICLDPTEGEDLALIG